ncbi:hypothetical protein KP509_05G079500 [Ceratopteris richardii]|nr:hypothetical protein KP509_05G079500 [Ceratopteris richardii]
MNQMDLQPSKVVYLSFLKACSAMNSLVHGRQIHDDIVRNGLNSDMQVGSLLIEMYSKCGMLQEAKNVFGRLSKHDVVVWCSLISGYIERDCNLQVLVMFHEMLRAAVRPDRITYIYVLKACGTMDGCQYGWLIHDLLVKDALESDSTILNSLIDMYGKLGNFKDALSSFSMLSYPDQISWGAIITGYVHHGYDELAVQTFADMQKRMIPDKVLFLLILKACKKLGAIRSGFLIHQELVESGMESDSEVARTLIYMYGGCRAIVEATHVFNCSSSKNVELWDALIGACSNHDEHNYIALFLFEKFLQQGFKPNKGIVLCVLGVCGALRTAWEGKCLHDDLIRGESELDQLMENCLIDMYSKCGLLKDARCVFDRLARPSEVSWGAMVAGYVGHGENLAAFELFERMEQMNIKENAVVLSCILKACGDLGASKQGKIVHNIVIKTTLATNDVWNSLVDMYAKCGRMAEAQKVFDGMSNKDLNSWGMLMAGYVQHGDSLKALDLYQKMHMLDIKPNRAVLIYMLQACSITGALVEGRLIFMQLIEDGFELDAVLGNTLLNMYTKCGSIQEACYVFAKLPSRDTASWSVLMGGFAQSNECGLAEKCVELMEQDGLKPGAAIFTSILAVCSHGGFLDKGLKHFSLMNVDHGFLPGEKHLSCINDLLGRAGHFKEAVDLFQSMPVHPDAILWTSLFDKCKQYENQRLGSQCFKELLNLDPDQASWYVLMLKIYANAVDSSAEAKGEETVKI